ncbi:response regulator [Olivibacter sp. SA151]|uniref:hybrid sensor histidine kinase/response regulator transcription factor n=1 Tax=Olivibacter jilunii TaxID=985016 RepID=UPI003F17270F
MRLLLSYIAIFSFTLCSGYGQEIRFTNVNIENGLSQNAVLSIAQDKRGFLWFGTRAGLNRYDAHRFNIYKNEPGNPYSLSDNYITALLCDHKGRLWIGTGNGLNMYEEASNKFKRITLPNAYKQEQTALYITCLYEDARQQVWIGTKDALYLYTMIDDLPSLRQVHLSNKKNYIRAVFTDRKGITWVALTNGIIRLKQLSKNTFCRLPSYDELTNSQQFSSLVEDKQGDIWLGSSTSGLFRWSATKNKVEPFNLPERTGKNLLSTSVRKLLLDVNNQLWIATQEGLSRLNNTRTQLSNCANEPWNPESLSQNSVHSLLEDKDGTIWAGTFFGGVNAYHSYQTPFHVYTNQTFRNGLSDNVISSIVEDEQQNLWIGTEGGGLNYWQRQSNQFTHYTHNHTDEHSLGSNLVKVVYRDRKKRIWVGTHGGGLNLYNPHSNNFRRFMWKDHATIGSEITSLLHDHNDQFWVGTETSGVQLFKLQDTSLIPLTKHPIVSATQRRAILSIFETTDGQIWIGGPNLFKIVSKNKIQTPFLLDKDVPFCINSFFQDAMGDVWLATSNHGLIQCDKQGHIKATYTERDGLSDNHVLGILPAHDQLLWISTANGLSRFDLRKKTFNTYNETDGLAGNVFNNNAYFKARTGELFFGGYKGLTGFMPDRISINKNAPATFITSLQILGNEGNILKKNSAIHQQLLKKEVILRYNQNTFVIQIAALNYVKPKKNRYQYQLAGYDKAWRFTDIPSLTYSNLAPGDYTLYVKAANNDNVWSEGTYLSIRVLPPIWKSPYAYCLYVLAIAGLIFLVIRHFFLKALLRKNQEVTQFKLNFFTHISHEIRTHLTLITGPTEDLIGGQAISATALEKLNIIKNNSDSLLKLVNELLDFRKIEVGMQTLKVSNYNLIAFVRLIISAFDSHSKDNPVEFQCDKTVLFLYFDKEQLEKVLVNLIANAFKFSEPGEPIKITIIENEKEVYLQVSNIGRGIPASNLDKIFAPYFQGTSLSTRGGSGIGLALAKSIIDLHHGSISASSEVLAHRAISKITFQITLPKGKSHFSPSELNQSDTENIVSQPILITGAEMVPSLSANQTDDSAKQLLLLVEDNAAMRGYLVSILEENYHIVTAQNGVEGLQQAFEHIPDMIISDVMMPEMDGFTFCEHMKTDPRTSHIPFILLTAKSATAYQITGLQTGADVYISKPFSPEVLRLQLRNLLKTRQLLQERYQDLLKANREASDSPMRRGSEALDNNMHPIDAAFLQKLSTLTRNHLDDPAFGVAWLAEEIGMSQPVLFKKIKAITGLSANDFVKSQRMIKAAELLKENRYTVYEIAFMVGYDNSKYFSREFKKWYGETPSDYAKAKG